MSIADAGTATEGTAAERLQDAWDAITGASYLPQLTTAITAAIITVALLTAARALRRRGHVVTAYFTFSTALTGTVVTAAATAIAAVQVTLELGGHPLALVLLSGATALLTVAFAKSHTWLRRRGHIVTSWLMTQGAIAGLVAMVTICGTALVHATPELLADLEAATSTAANR